MEIIGDVKYKDDFIEFSRAQKVVFDMKTKEMIITGVGGLTFYGIVELKQERPFKGVMRYKIGDKTAFLE